LNYLLYYTQNPQKYQSLFAKFSVLRKKVCSSLPQYWSCRCAPFAVRHSGGSGLCIQVFGDMSVKKQGFSSSLCLVHSGIFQYNKEAEKKNKRCDQNGSPRCFVFCGAAAPGEKRSAVQ